MFNYLLNWKVSFFLIIFTVKKRLSWKISIRLIWDWKICTFWYFVYEYVPGKFYLHSSFGWCSITFQTDYVSFSPTCLMVYYNSLSKNEHQTDLKLKILYSLVFFYILLPTFNFMDGQVREFQTRKRITQQEISLLSTVYNRFSKGIYLQLI